MITISEQQNDHLAEYQELIDEYNNSDGLDRLLIIARGQKMMKNWRSSIKDEFIFNGPIITDNKKKYTEAVILKEGEFISPSKSCKTINTDRSGRPIPNAINIVPKNSDITELRVLDLCELENSNDLIMAEFIRSEMHIVDETLRRTPELWNELESVVKNYNLKDVEIQEKQTTDTNTLKEALKLSPPLNHYIGEEEIKDILCENMKEYMIVTLHYELLGTPVCVYGYVHFTDIFILDDCEELHRKRFLICERN